MIKHIFIITLLVLSGIVTTATAIDNYEKADVKITIADTENTNEKQYVVKDYNGQIAVFYKNTNKPEEIYNIYTDSLPVADSQKIKQGIRLSEEELSEFISDYTS